MLGLVAASGKWETNAHEGLRWAVSLKRASRQYLSDATYSHSVIDAKSGFTRAPVGAGGTSKRSRKAPHDEEMLLAKSMIAPRGLAFARSRNADNYVTRIVRQSRHLARCGSRAAQR